MTAREMYEAVQRKWSAAAHFTAWKHVPKKIRQYWKDQAAQR